MLDIGRRLTGDICISVRTVSLQTGGESVARTRGYTTCKASMNYDVYDCWSAGRNLQLEIRRAGVFCE